MSTQTNAVVAVEQSQGAPGTDDWQQEYDLDARPSEFESAFLTIAMFGGLIIFAVGCFLLVGW